MRAGRLRHRLVLQQPVTSRDADTNEKITVWTTVATVWGGIEPIKGKERVSAQELDAAYDVRLPMRYSSEISGMDATWRATSGGRVYAFQSVINMDERNREIEVLASEGVQDGG